MNKLYIPVILGTSRPDRRSLPVANFIVEIINKMGIFTTELVDPQNFNLPFDGKDPANQDSKYSEITKKADGFFIVVPEYNHSFPGSLKRLLDSEFDNYAHKPVAYAGVSNGPWGGIRAIHSLIQTTRALGLVSTKADVQFAQVSKMINEDGKITDEKTEQRVMNSINELIWMAEALKWGRDNNTSEKKE